MVLAAGFHTMNQAAEGLPRENVGYLTAAENVAEQVSQIHNIYQSYHAVAGSWELPCWLWTSISLLRRHHWNKGLLFMPWVGKFYNCIPECIHLALCVSVQTLRSNYFLYSFQRELWDCVLDGNEPDGFRANYDALILLFFISFIFSFAYFIIFSASSSHIFLSCVGLSCRIGLLWRGVS